jgi:hypothetical protein
MTMQPPVSLWSGVKPAKKPTAQPVAPAPNVPAVEPPDSNARWAMVLGDDLTMQSFDDAGNPLETTMRIDRQTGRMEILKDPVKPLEVATKQYVDATAGQGGGLVTKMYVDEQDALRVLKSGDTMSGPLTLPGDPTANTHAATKQYVDAHAGTGSTEWDDITGKPTTFPPAPHNHAISEITGLQAALDSKIPEAPSDGKSYGRRNVGWDWVVSHTNDIVDGGNF